MSDTIPVIEELIDTKGLTPDEIKALREYSQSVDYLAKQGFNLEFNNKDQHHAAFVMAAIFENAKTSIKIFTGSFSGEVSNNSIYLKHLEEGITNKNKKVEVIFENTPNSDSRCYQMLKRLQGDKKDIKMYALPASYKKTVLDTQMKGKLGHFTIGDDKMFRYETDKEKFTAYCNFDDKSIVATLNKNFDIFKLNSVTLQ